MSSRHFISFKIQAESYTGVRQTDVSYTGHGKTSKGGKIDKTVSPITLGLEESSGKKAPVQLTPLQIPNISDQMYYRIDQWLSSQDVATGETIENLDKYFTLQKEAISRAHKGAFSNLIKTGLCISGKSSLFLRRKRLRKSNAYDDDVNTQISERTNLSQNKKVKNNLISKKELRSKKRD